jgi:hypothetical protein
MDDRSNNNEEDELNPFRQSQSDMEDFFGMFSSAYLSKPI